MSPFCSVAEKQVIAELSTHEDLSSISLCDSLRSSSLAYPAPAHDKQRDPNPFVLCVLMIILRSSTNKFHCTCRARESIINHNSGDSCQRSIYKFSEILGDKRALYMQILTFLLRGVKLFPPQRMKILGVLVELSPSFNDPLSRVARLTFDYL